MTRKLVSQNCNTFDGTAAAKVFFQLIRCSAVIDLLGKKKKIGSLFKNYETLNA
jgi:hypothetical protein